MNTSLNWLSDLLGTKLDPEDAAHRLAMLGAPVEAIDPVHQDLAEIVVGVVERVEKHPNADRLSLCYVNNGAETLEVVCGASNVEAGKKYPYAALGAVLPGGLKLKGRKIRGVKSNGMLCSARELELGADAEGILELDTDAPAGTPLLDAIPIGDYRLDVEVTPNRPDLLGHKGIARELGAVLGRPVKLPTIPGAPQDTEAPQQVKERGSVGGVEVVLEDTEGCPRYMAAVIEGVKIGPSPEWLQARLRNIGQRPINSVVDATNYLLFEVNQPMHAFDRAKLKGSKIVVRRARDSESITTLDGEDRTLTAEMTAICDAVDATAVGGVIGGRGSEVSADTTDLVLECAYFDPKRIRATRNTLKLSTEASYRYERGTDIDGMADALRRAVSLIMAVAGGSEPGPPVDVYPHPAKTPAVFLRPERVARLLGVAVPSQDIERYLTSIGFSVAPKNGRLAVHAPGWRPDISREEDLIEEIARLRGFDSFPSEVVPLRPSTVPTDPSQPLEARIRRILTGLGLHEAKSSPLGPKTSDRAQPVLNPLSVEEGFLRTDLMSGLVRAAEHNWSVRERNIRLFEIGSVFTVANAGERPGERRGLAGVISGHRQPVHWSNAGKSVDFDQWDVKSLFEEGVRAAGLVGTVEQSDDRWVFRDGAGSVHGWAGEVPAERPAWAGRLFGFELKALGTMPRVKQVGALPNIPPVERDVALMLPEGVTAGTVEALLTERGGTLLESAELFDEFRSEGVAGRSVAWRLVFRSPTRTLRDKEVDALLNKILTALKEQLGVERREA